MKKQLLLMLLASVFLIASCSNSSEINEGTASNLENDEVKQLIEAYSGNQTSKQSASVTGTELIITEENGEETTYNLPKDDFFVSIAPFKDLTHPCMNHSLTGCQGELSAESFDVLIKDESGNVIIQETMSSGENGFIDLWLPRYNTFFITITQGNKQAKSKITTNDDSPTCITTMQLS